MKALFKYYGPAILWASFVLIMCSIDLGGISKASIFFPGFDKLAHCGFFFVLVIFCCTGLIRQQSRKAISYKSIIIITAIAVLYGGLIELLQLTIFTWRSGEWADLFADAVGASMGAFGTIITVKAMNYVKE
ncbi:MAG TPA: VanZ family protein [Mucilaginibacter sp.]|jgi:VanZ family protein